MFHGPIIEYVFIHNLTGQAHHLALKISWLSVRIQYGSVSESKILLSSLGDLIPTLPIGDLHLLFSGSVT